MKIVITGASGFLGGHLFAQAQRLGQPVGLFHQFPIPARDHPTYQLDLSDRKRLQEILEEVEPQIIIHNAALANPEYCEEHQDLARLYNIEATRHITTWCRASGARLIYISTDLVFDGTKGDYNENDSPAPVNFYGYTKTEAEKIVLDQLPEALVCRLSLMFGDGYWQRDYASAWLQQALRLRLQNRALPPLLLYSDQYRSMLAVTNAAEVIIELALSAEAGIMHIGAPEKLSRFAFGRLLCQHLGYPKDLIQPVTIQEMPPKVARPADVSMNVAKAQRVLRIPLLSIKDGLKKAFG